MSDNLDVMAANINSVHLIIPPADNSTIPSTPAVMESHTTFSLRAQPAFEGLSFPGPVGAYEFHGRSSDGRVADVSNISPEPACVTISVLSRKDNGATSYSLLAEVRNALNDEGVRSIVDRVCHTSAHAWVSHYFNDTTKGCYHQCTNITCGCTFVKTEKVQNSIFKPGEVTPALPHPMSTGQQQIAWM